MPRMAGSFKLTKDAAAGEFKAFAFPLNAKLGFAQLGLSCGCFPAFGSIHLFFNGFAFPASRHVPIVRIRATLALARSAASAQQRSKYSAHDFVTELRSY